MTLTAQVQEVLDDLGSDLDQQVHRLMFFDEAMPMVTDMLVAKFESVVPIIRLFGLLNGETDEQIGEKVRENALCGSFTLGLFLGLEMQKRGYVPAPDPTKDQP